LQRNSAPTALDDAASKVVKFTPNRNKLSTGLNNDSSVVPQVGFSKTPRQPKILELNSGWTIYAGALKNRPLLSIDDGQQFTILGTRTPDHN
jgi:hypothetical protein